MMRFVVLVLCSLAACSRGDDIDLAHDFATAGKNALEGLGNLVKPDTIINILESFIGKRNTHDGIAQTLQLAVNQAKSVVENYSQKAKQAYSEFQKVKGDAQKFEKVLQDLKHNQNLDLFKIINNVGVAVDTLTHGKRDVVDDIQGIFNEFVEHIKHPEGHHNQHILEELLHHHQTPRTYQKRTLFLLQSLLNNLLPSTAASGSGNTPNSNNNNDNKNSNNNVNTNINTNVNVNPPASGAANNFQVDLTQLLQLLQQQQQQEGR